MPILVIEGAVALLDGEPIRSGDLLELLEVGGRWIVGIFWSSVDPIQGLTPGWYHQIDAPCLRIPLAVASEEHGAPTDRWPDDEADFRPYAALLLRPGCVMRWKRRRAR